MENQLIVEESIKLIDSRSGLPIIKVRGESGKWVTLHSMIDPEKESRIMADNFNISDDKIAVILGLGMGYHLFEILSRERKCLVIVVEKNEEIYEAFLSEYADDERLADKQVIFVTDENNDAVIEKLSKIQIENGFKPFKVIEHTPSIRAFPGFYLELKSRIESIGKINIGSKMNYVKFKDEKVKILILHSKYYLLPEIINSIKTLGHEQQLIMINTGDDGEGSADVIESIISNIIDFKPDFILTVNHLGFDREGILTEFFNEIKIPYASWYVDSPIFIMDVFNNQISDYLTVFLWDRDYIDDLKDYGINNVFYLPLATDEKIFKRSAVERSINYHCDVGFVGSSWVNSYNKCLEKLPKNSSTLNLIDKLADQFNVSPEKNLEKIELRLTGDEELLYKSMLNSYRSKFLPAVTWRATQKYRLSCVNEILSFKPHIHGDPGWKNFLNGETTLLPELNYYDDLSGFYKSCKINFNTTCQQMKTGINQRVFDVPSTQSFLITDYRSQLEEHFEIGKEVICYKDTDEIKDLVTYYLKNDSAREKIVKKAFKRIVRDHTYINRMEVMIDKMREIYA